MPNFSISKKTLTGYKRVRNFVGIFQGQVEKMSVKFIKAGAMEFARQVRGIIRKQSYAWKPLSERWLRYKRKHGLDKRVHMATRTYVKSIKATARRRGGKIVSWGVTAGKPNQIHEPSGFTFKKLARILEFGSKRMRIPPRPHWRPAWSAYVRKDAKLLLRSLKKEVFKKAARKVKPR